MHLSLITRKYR